MDQKELYTSLNQAGCKVMSFEDFPAQYGSWRVSFMIENMSCTVTCNRADSILTLSARSITSGNQTLTLSSKALVSDRLELGKVAAWIRSLTISKLSTPNPQRLETMV